MSGVDKVMCEIIKNVPHDDKSTILTAIYTILDVLEHNKTNNNSNEYSNKYKFQLVRLIKMYSYLNKTDINEFFNTIDDKYIYYTYKIQIDMLLENDVQMLDNENINKCIIQYYMIMFRLYNLDLIDELYNMYKLDKIYCLDHIITMGNTPTIIYGTLTSYNWLTLFKRTKDNNGLFTEYSPLTLENLGKIEYNKFNLFTLFITDTHILDKTQIIKYFLENRNILTSKDITNFIKLSCVQYMNKLSSTQYMHNKTCYDVFSYDLRKFVLLLQEYDYPLSKDDIIYLVTKHVEIPYIRKYIDPSDSEIVQACILNGFTPESYGFDRPIEQPVVSGDQNEYQLYQMDDILVENQ